jgi:hypothetical protein
VVVCGRAAIEVGLALRSFAALRMTAGYLVVKKHVLKRGPTKSAWWWN